MPMAVTYTNFGGRIVSDGIKEFLTDPLGSLVAEIMDDFTNTFEAEYWPYGEPQVETGLTASPFRFCGLLGYLSEYVGLLYVRARYYEPNLAGWLTVDPLWPAFHQYNYCFSRPTYSTDPSGLAPYIFGENVQRWRTLTVRCWQEVEQPPFWKCFVPPIWGWINGDIVPCRSKCRIFYQSQDTDYFLWLIAVCTAPALVGFGIPAAICDAVLLWYGLNGAGCSKANGDTCFTIDRPCLPTTPINAIGTVDCCPGYGPQ